MAYPPNYQRRYDFVSYQTVNPTKPLPAQEHENEYNAIALSLNGVIQNIKLIQRADGALANQVVGWDQLSPEVTIGIAQPTDWVTNTAYAENDMVYYAYRIYRCVEAHVSGPTFNGDLAAGKWQVQVDFVTATTDAQEAAARAEAALDSFTDVYLGAFSIPPNLDLDGNPIQTGALYFDIPTAEMRVRNSSGAWQYIGSSVAAGVSSFNTRTGAVTLTAQDVSGTGVLAGLATTTYVDTQDGTLATAIGLKADKTYVDTQDANLSSAIAAVNTSKAPLDSPSFTGDPKAPTPPLGDNDTSIATTQWVRQQGYSTSQPDVTKAYVDAADAALDAAKYPKTGGAINGPTAPKRTALGTVTGTLTADMALGNDFSATIASAVLLGTPQNAIEGQSGCIYLTMQAGAVLTFSAAWDWEGGTVPTPSTGAAVDVIAYVVRTVTSGTPSSIVAKYLKAVA